MKIQELAIIFIIIILPISLVISEYTQFQIQTISLQTEYDTKLTVATYDAIKAFQLNTQNESYSDMTNQKLSDLTASINAFRNSLRASFKLNGYTEEELDNYIPALVYTLYDGFYIYSPYENIVDSNGEILEDKSQRESLYGIKPYINYSCRYIASGIDVVITYALDNYISVRGQINGEYVNKSGYLIDGIEYNTSKGTVKYNSIEIKTEHLKEELLGKICSYVRVNGTKYYLLEDYFQNDNGSKDDGVVYVLNGKITVQTVDPKEVTAWRILMENNDTAITYYRDAYEFSKWFKSETNLDDLTYGDAVYENGEIDEETGNIKKIWKGDTTKIFDFNTSGEIKDNIENELSNFNQHRLAVIRHKIESNLAVAISNYNTYSGAATNNVFQMPELKENEWDDITHNISLMSFLQGLHIGGKIYNGYTVVTNTQSNEVVMEDDIYYLGADMYYHKMGDIGLENEGGVQLSAKVQVSEETTVDLGSAGRLNLDFERAIITDPKKNETYYYYPLKQYNASYDSVVMQNNVKSYEDIYQYVNSQSAKLKETFYTALARERYSAYRATNEVIDFYSVLFVGIPENDVFTNLKYYANLLNEEKGIMVESYMEIIKGGADFSQEKQNEISEYIKSVSDRYHLIIVDPLYWGIKINSEAYYDILKATNLFTISNDSNTGLPIIKSANPKKDITAKPNITLLGEEHLSIEIGNVYDTQWYFYFDHDNYDIDVFYTATYDNGITGEYDYIGCVKNYVENSNYKWMHSQFAFSNTKKSDMDLFKHLIYYILSDNISNNM